MAQAKQAGAMFALYKDEALHDLVKGNMVGGPSLVFHRYHRAGETYIRGDPNYKCAKIEGYDTNALYPWCIAQEMLTGFPSVRRKENGFAVRMHYPLALEWLTWIFHSDQRTICHRFNGGEKRIGVNRLAVDGWDAQNNTVYELDGCFWHGYSCHLTQHMNGFHPILQKTFDQLQAETRAKHQFICDAGHILVVTKACEWKEIKRCRAVAAFVREFCRPSNEGSYLMTQEQILAAVERGELFSMVECDIDVPEDRKEEFAEFPPIFKNTNVSKKDVGATMMQFAKEQGLMRQLQRMLISSFSGEKMLFVTPLLRWYLEKGLQVTNVTQVIQYTPQAVLENWWMTIQTLTKPHRPMQPS